MNNPARLCFALLILLFLLAGCTARIPEGEMPDIGVPMENANRDMEIYSPKGYRNSFTNGHSLGLRIRVLSDYSILHQLNAGTKLFMYQDQQWVEIENNMHYPPELDKNYPMPPSENDILKEGFISVVPYYPDLKSAAPVRLIIVGNIVRDGEVTDELSVGYFDFVLNP